VAGRDLFEPSEPQRLEPRTESLGRHVDGRLGPEGEGEDSVTARRGDPGELLEEGDHVHEDDEVERGGVEGKSGGVGDLEAHSRRRILRQDPPCLGDHPWREIDAHNLGFWKAPRNHAGGLAGPGADVEHLPRDGGQAVERGFEREERLRAEPRFPAPGHPVERVAERTAEDAPERRSSHDGARRHTREALAERVQPLRQAGQSSTS
jgi:hypothetical protein